MTKDDLNKLIAYQLGNVTGQYDVIDLQIDAAITRLEQLPFQPWFLLSENNSTQTIIGDRRLPIPIDFLGVYEEGTLYIAPDGDGRMVPLAKKSQDELRPYYNDKGVPKFYALTNKYFRLFPEPDAAYDMELLYYAKTAVPMAVDNPWLVNVPDLLIYTVVQNMLTPRKDGNADKFKALADMEYQKLIARHTAREELDRDAIYGGEDIA